MSKVAATVSTRQLHDSYDAFRSVQKRAQDSVNQVYRMMEKSKKGAPHKGQAAQRRVATKP
jgi:hypothetical protein